MYTHIGVLCRVRGFVDAALVEREWAGIVTDQGALSRVVLDDSDPKFRRLLHIPGTGHESTVYLRAIHALLNSFGFDAVLANVYAASPSVVAYLKRGADVHQVRDWVHDVVLPSLWRAAAREYIQSAPGEKDAAGFEVWMRSSCTDPRFAFVSDLLLHALAALRCVHVGIQRSRQLQRWPHGDSAVHVWVELHMYMITRGAINYVPLVIRDHADCEFLCTPEVRRWRHATLSCANGQGPDYNLEELHLVCGVGAAALARSERRRVCAWRRARQLAH